MKWNKGNTQQLESHDYKEINSPQGNETKLLNFEVHSLGENSCSGISSEEEGRMFKDKNLGKYGRLKSSIEEPPEVELRPLPEYLEYAFLAEESKLPIIITSDLMAE